MEENQVKNIRDVLIIPADKNKSAFGASIDPSDLNPGDIAIDWDMAGMMKELTAVPLDHANDEKILEQRADFLRRHGLFPDHRPIKASHWGRKYLDEKIKSAPKYQGKISESELKKFIAKECENYTLNQKRPRKFIWDEKAKFMVKNMMFYFGNDSRCVWPIDKGLFLYGNTGIGKTMLFEIFRDVSRKRMKAGAKNFKMIKCLKINKAYELVKWKISKGIALADDEGIAQYTIGNWCFDDIGSEPLEINDYGNKMIVMEEILLQRIDHFAKGEYFTYMTSNLSIEELQDRYGLRLTDRIMQMCTPVHWEGESKRLIESL